MVEFTLPPNSRVRPGKTHSAPAGAAKPRRFKVYRWEPDGDENPRVDTYEIDVADCGPMFSTRSSRSRARSIRRSPSGAPAARGSAALAP